MKHYLDSSSLPGQAAVRRVAVLVDTSTTWGRSVLRGINGYRLNQRLWEIYVEPRGLEEHLRIPAGWRGDGIIARVSNRRMLRELKALNLPVVNVSGIQLAGMDFPSVTTDLAASARMAAKHFLERGFRHFAYFSLTGLNYIARHRQLFTAAVEAGGGLVAAYAVKPRTGAEPDWSLDLEKLGQWLKRLPKPVAVLCWNASSARELIFASHQMGIPVPEEVAVLCQADDEALCETALVPISGIATAGEGIGCQAAEILDGLMQGNPPASQVTRIEPLKVVARQSTDTLAINDPALVRALSYLRQQASQAIKVEQVAKAAGVSRRVLERRFLERLHRSPADEIRRVRLELAQRLLLETELPMTEVAYAAGFGSQAYFADSFHRQLGMPPRDYRLKYRPPRAPHS